MGIGDGEIELLSENRKRGCVEDDLRIGGIGSGDMDGGVVKKLKV